MKEMKNYIYFISKTYTGFNLHFMQSIEQSRKIKKIIPDEINLLY
jgi:hypothetical protein